MVPSAISRMTYLFRKKYLETLHAPQSCITHAFYDALVLAFKRFGSWKSD